MKLSDMRRFLTERNIQLTKSLGQNFLHDQNQLRRIVAQAELKPKDRVLEIGPGLGPLTELLVAQAGEVIAVEKDERLVKVLRERFEVANLTLVHDDALVWLRRQPRNWTGWKLVANLPYSVASPILVELAQGRSGPDRIVATLQSEVVQRLMARAGEEDYGLLTLLVQLDYEPVSSFKIPATCFFPAPDIDSACVTLVRRPDPLLPADSRDAFCRIVKRAFSQRRKVMAKLLRQDWPAGAIEQALSHLHLPPQCRAEAVSLEQFAQLTRLLTTASPALAASTHE
jgi:16S rRNA (adenine1518-N6/adenine1519-N6)-dimethyltransferase